MGFIAIGLSRTGKLQAVYQRQERVRLNGDSELKQFQVKRVRANENDLANLVPNPKPNGAPDRSRD